MSPDNAETSVPTGSGGNVGLLVGVSFLIVFITLLVSLAVVYIRRRRHRNEHQPMIRGRLKGAFGGGDIEKDAFSEEAALLQSRNEWHCMKESSYSETHDNSSSESYAASSFSSLLPEARPHFNHPRQFPKSSTKCATPDVPEDVSPTSTGELPHPVPFKPSSRNSPSPTPSLQRIVHRPSPLPPPTIPLPPIPTPTPAIQPKRSNTDTIVTTTTKPRPLPVPLPVRFPPSSHSRSQSDSSIPNPFADPLPAGVEHAPSPSASLIRISALLGPTKGLREVKTRGEVEALRQVDKIQREIQPLRVGKRGQVGYL
ncbi:hypothetical protein L218DRAFT_987111 [Marasmius fiardii PR-910]|nr:hypothetical protein L218DRAFT_987111 [Marasmius fiardii PR-910]